VGAEGGPDGESAGRADWTAAAFIFPKSTRDSDELLVVNTVALGPVPTPLDALLVALPARLLL